MICSACGAELEIGDWPYCPHGAMREENAKRFDPIVVWESNSDSNQLSFPGQANETVPAGYHKIEITNMRQADELVRRVNGIERSKAEVQRYLNNQAFDEQTKRRRDDTLARIRGNPRAEALFRAAREYADRRKEEKRARQRLDPRFHIQVLSFDSGNRNSYSGPETGWRERKS